MTNNIENNLIDFERWLEQSPQEILSRWYSTGLSYAQGLDSDQLAQVGEKLAQSFMSVFHDHDASEIMFRSFPLNSHRLMSMQACQRFVVLDRALDNEPFREAFLNKLTPELEQLAVDQFMETGKDRKNLPLPNVAAWITRLSFRQMTKKESFSNDMVETWLSLFPGDSQTQEAVLEQIGQLRSSYLSEFAIPCPDRPASPKSKM